MTLPWLRSSVLSAALLVALFSFSERRADGVPGRSSSEASPHLEAAAYRQAAAAVRERNFPEARQRLAALTGRDDAAGRQARLVLGLYAHAHEELEEAAALLGAANDPTGPLEDWRLFILADVSQAMGQTTAAQEALGRLLAVHRASPLRHDALLLAARLAQGAGQFSMVLELVEAARRDGASAQLCELEELAWAVGVELREPHILEEAARRLLVEYPLTASRLKVIEHFRQPSGELDWPAILTVQQLERRARRLHEAGLHPNALAALDFVPLAERGFEWSLLRAEVLTGAQRGGEALQLLASVVPADDRARVRLAWQRALAALDAATVRRGRTNLPAAQRRAIHHEALRQLRSVVQRGSDRHASLRALRLLFAELGDEGDFDEVLEVLTALRRLEPSDQTGARFLWRRGWREYDGRNYSGAIGLWSRLQELYPESSLARGGHYWSARAHQHLGRRQRATEIFREIAAVETTDFYSLQAAARLREEPPPTAGRPRRPTEPWPEDRRLERARRLSGLGLDDLALRELTTLEHSAEPRAFHALQAVILAQQGKRRESIQALWQAFPNLGGAHQASAPERALLLYYPLDYHYLVHRYASEKSLSPHIVMGMIRQESAFDPAARSWAGARGLMQMMPATGRELARRIGLQYSAQRLSDPEFSIRLGTTYFRQVLEMFDGNEELALAGYNGGPYRIRRLWRRAGARPELDRFLEGLRLEETKTYVKRVVLFADSYRKLYGELG